MVLYVNGLYMLIKARDAPLACCLLSQAVRIPERGKRLFLCVAVQSCILPPPRLTDMNSPYILTCVTHVTTYLISSENILDVIVLLLFTTHIK